MANLFASDAIHRNSSRFFTWGDDPHFTALFLETYSKLNPLFPKGLSFPLGEVFAAVDIMSHAALEATPFYKGYMQPQGYVDFLAANLEKAATSVATFAVARHERDGVVDGAARRRMGLIAPHVRRAVLIGRVLDFNTLQAETLVETVDGLASGVLLVDAEGRLVHANASGKTLLQGEHPLKLVQGILVAVDESTQRRLRAVFVGLSNGDAAVETSGVAVPARGRDDQPFTIHVLPLTAGAQGRAPTSAVAALFLHKETVDLLAAIESASQLYGLTPSEARVLRAVIEIGGLAGIASALELSRSTVKTHLEHLFEKTGCSRQADLIKLVAGFDAVRA